MLQAFDLKLENNQFEEEIKRLDEALEHPCPPYRLLRRAGEWEDEQEKREGKIKENIHSVSRRIKYSPDGKLLMSETEKEWFPEIEADVFLSHSHQDETLVKRLARWLYVRFGIRSFIDSCVWGYADELLHEIDVEYCLHDNCPDCFDYLQRNRSTAHVHMLLSAALAKMIQATDYLIFVNTPRSIDVEEQIKGESMTASPWIYSELTLSRVIAETIKATMKRIEGTIGEPILEHREMQTLYAAPMDHLLPLKYADLLSLKDCSVTEPKGAFEHLKAYAEGRRRKWGGIFNG